MAADFGREFGRLEAQVKKLEDDVSEIKSDIKAVRSKLDKADGSVRAFLIVGSVMAFVGAMLSKIITWLFP